MYVAREAQLDSSPNPWVASAGAFELNGGPDEIRHRFCLGLLPYAVLVRVDGVDADAEVTCYLAAGESCGEADTDVTLTLRERSSVRSASPVGFAGGFVPEGVNPVAEVQRGR